MTQGRHVSYNHITFAVMAILMTGLSSCDGIFGGIYDEPPVENCETAAGQLYVDASKWGYWHYIDLKAVSREVLADPSFNPSSLWSHYAVPLEETAGTAGEHAPGIYTYWYDVFGQGISKNEYRDFYPTEPQPAPEEWTIAVHRNNVRTNGGAVARTGYHSFDELPEGTRWLDGLEFVPDEWNEKDVWTIQDRMLLGLIGNQGIEINSLLSSWLRIEIPPMPPAFTHGNDIFILRLADGSAAALQLEDYQSATGTKCCLTINYRYPL